MVETFPKGLGRIRQILTSLLYLIHAEGLSSISRKININIEKDIVNFHYMHRHLRIVHLNSIESSNKHEQVQPNLGFVYMLPYKRRWAKVKTNYEMEWHTLFTNWKDWYCKCDSTSQTNLDIRCNLKTIPTRMCGAGSGGM